MEPPLKRIRLDAQPGILTCIDALCASKGSILRETMLELLTLDPNVETIIRQNYDFLTDKPTDMADVNFDHYAKDLWRKIQRPYTGFQPEEDDDDRDEYDIISEQILDWLRAVVGVIREQSKGDDVSYATKRSALLTLCKIAKIICVSDGEGDQDGGTAVGDWVQEKFMQMNAGPWVYDVIRDIITTLSAQERDDMCREKAGRVTLMERMEELDILARSTDLGLAGEDGTFAELLGGISEDIDHRYETL